MNIDPHNCKIMLTEPPMNPLKNREKMIEVGLKKLSKIYRMQCCGSGWFPDPGSKNSNKREGLKKKIFVIPFYVATNFTKLKIILVLKC
jgi:hypothetical protein